MGKHNRRRKRYPKEGQDAPDLFDNRQPYRRGTQEPPRMPPASSKRGYNPFQHYLQPQRPAPNPNQNPNDGAKRKASLSNQAEWENRQRNLKRYLVQILNQAAQKIELWFPDMDMGTTQHSSESDSEEEMDWQPEDEVIIPQACEVRYIWDLDKGTRFERPPFEGTACYGFPGVGFSQRRLGLGSELRGPWELGSWCAGAAGTGRALEIRNNEEDMLNSP
ncbi:hypothetical protein EG329_001383 [Mollisiaceae sp. DMI_Dod_QoI]|nr:hypothetical protein EG329_001383 [Helotiales sp. DMI_Dod_QoI]